MNKAHSGSIVFTMVITITLVTVVLYCLLRSNYYCASLVYEREKHEKHYQLAYSLYSFVKNQHKEKFEKGTFVDQEVIYQSAWPDMHSKYMGKVWIDGIEGSHCTICVDIVKNKKILLKLNFPCDLSNQ